MRVVYRGVAGLAALLALVAFLAAPGPARAAEFVSGPNPSIPVGRTIDDDTYVSGGTITIDGTVRRDLIVAGGTVTINGEVGGNLTVAGGTVDVNGPVRGAVRVAAGTATLGGPIGWDLVILSGQATVKSGARIGHDLVVGGGTVRLDGEVARDLRGSAGSLTINGRVGRDVHLRIDDQLRVAPGARVDGNLVYTSSHAADIAPGSVGGQVTFNRPVRDPVGQAVRWVLRFLLRYAWALAAGTLLVLLLPRATAQVTDTLRARPVVSFAWGAGLVVLTPIVALVLAITVIGFPAALILAGLYVAGLYLSQVIVGLALGRLIFPAAWRDADRVHLWVAMAVGVLIVLVVRLLPIPYGWTFWVSLLVAFLALGAIWTRLTGWGLAGRGAPPPPATEPVVIREITE